MKAIVAAVDKAGVVACEGFELHWSPYFLIVHKLIKANAFGNIFYGECDYFSANWPQWYVGYPWVKTREQGGSALAAAGCHAVDALLQFMPGEVDHVVGHWGNFTKTFDWEGTVLSVISYKDGRIGKVGCILEGNNPIRSTSACTATAVRWWAISSIGDPDRRAHDRADRLGDLRDDHAGYARGRTSPLPAADGPHHRLHPEQQEAGSGYPRRAKDRRGHLRRGAVCQLGGERVKLPLE